MSGRVVVAGLGNVWRGDDAAGIEAVRRLRERLPEAVEVVETEAEPTRLISLCEGVSTLVVVDAVSTGSPPGTVHRIDAARDPLPAGVFRSSTHHVSLGDTIELARALGRLPAVTVLVGIEGESWDTGDGLSPAAARGVAEAVELVASLTEAA